MRTRLTPLNFAAAGLLVALVYPLLDSGTSDGEGLNTILLLALLIVCLLADILFRSLLRNLKRIWIVEVLFLIFAVISLLIIRSF